MSYDLKPRIAHSAGPRLLHPACLSALLSLAATSAGALEVTGSFTGWWGQPDQESHGVIVSVSQKPDGTRQGVIYWANYDNQGNPSWFIAQGPVVGDTVDATMYRVEGVTFMQPEDASVTPLQSVGSMQLTFSNCSNGDVTFDTPQSIVGTGGFRIARLTNQPGTSCSGGIADNTSPTAPPEAFTTFLVGTQAAPAASGKAEFESIPGRADFQVEIEDLPLGAYTLRVGGIERGQIDVVSTAGGNQGEIEFRSPVEVGKVLLDFDPRDQLIEVLDGTTVVLEGAAPTSGSIPGADQGTPPPFGNSEIEVDLTNAGAFPAASGDVELEQRATRVDFNVEIEDLPVGPYTLTVDGVARGTIQVVDTADGPEGELEFRFPVEPGKLALDFDPRGATIEVSDASGAVLAVTFPANGAGGDDGSGGDDSGDDGSGDDAPNDIEIEVGMTNSGRFPAGLASARFERNVLETKFEIRAEGIPAGAYPIIVDGIERGVLQMIADDDETEGEIEFRDPQDEDSQPLDFDPRGQRVEITDGTTTLFSTDFPG